MSIAINKKVKFDGARCPFSTFLRLQGDHHCACAQKWCHFSFFSKSFQTKKIKALRPKMTKIASRGSCLKEGLGTYTGQKVHIKMDAACTPKFFKAGPVPYAQREAVEKEPERLEREDIIEPVSHSEWAPPVVTATKDDGSLRLCGDYKRSVNPACHVDQYPLPRVNDMFARLAGCKRFTKIDRYQSQAYLQLTLDEESQSVTTINTLRGLFRFKRLPFGIASSSAIFKRTIE